jgi:1A family penicillin-binding protein
MNKIKKYFLLPFRIIYRTLLLPSVRRFFLYSFIFFSTLFLIFGGGILLWASTLSLPTIDAVILSRQSHSTKIYDSTGEVLLFDMHQDIRRTEVPLEDISLFAQNATIAIEDERFYSHMGIDFQAIIRAVVKNIQGGNLLGGEGGSTITQQVIKNALLSREKTITRKIKEWVLAVKLERELTKKEILELYLNEIPYGGNKYGIEEASQNFFGVSAKDLSLIQSAYLAALPQAPTYFSPYGNNREDLEKRKNTVLERMFRQNLISEEEYLLAKEEKITFSPNTSAHIKAPHFVFYVLEEITKTYEEEELADLGLKIITTLDYDLQKEAEDIVYRYAHENEEKFSAKNASLVAINPKNGDILTMVGSRDYFDEFIDGNFNIALAKRQPGSVFKPFAYAAAIEKGYTTETVVYDVPTQFSTSCEMYNFTSEGGCYSPQNYDNAFRGPITFRNALSQSVNIPAVKVLYLAGMKNTIDLARRMGISTLEDYRRYGLTLVLGGGEVSLLDVVSSYGVFANEGTRYTPSAIRKITDSSGKILFDEKKRGEEVLNPFVTHSITDILSDNTARSPAFGSNSLLHFPSRDVAVKTGTTNDYRDAWIVGYTPSIVVGAWAGNNDNTEMEKRVAGFIIAPLWNSFMQEFFKKNPENEIFKKPLPLDGGIHPILNGDTLFTENGVPHSLLHYISKESPLDPTSPPSKGDAQYPYWEYGVRAYTGISEEENSSLLSIQGEQTENFSLSIISPKRRDRFSQRDSIEVEIEIKEKEGFPFSFSHTEYYIDEQFLERNNSMNFSFTPEEYNVENGEQTLVVIVYDKEGKYTAESVPVEIR